MITEELLYNYNFITGKRYSLGPRVVRSVDLDPRVFVPTPTALTPVDRGSSFGSLLGGGANIIVPVNTDFGIVIEKINELYEKSSFFLTKQIVEQVIAEVENFEKRKF